MKIVDGDRELIRPVSVAIPYQKVAALFGGHLLDDTKPQILSLRDAGLQLYSDAAAGAFGETAIATPAWIPLAAETGPRAIAGVDAGDRTQPRQRRLVDAAPLALPDDRAGLVRFEEPEPLEILQQRRVERRTAPDPVVILDAHQYLSTSRPGQAPYVNGVDHMSEVEEPCR
jgi:hypothetical protein